MEGDGGERSLGCGTGRERERGGWGLVGRGFPRLQREVREILTGLGVSVKGLNWSCEICISHDEYTCLAYNEPPNSL